MRVIGRTLAPLAALGIIGMALAGCADSPAEPLVKVSPAEPGTNDRLLLQIAERSGVDYEVVWTVDGGAVEEELGNEVPADLTARGQVWEATVTPTDADGKAFDPTVVSVAIGNAAPAGIVTLSPSAPQTGQDMLAQLGFTDPDGDDVSASYSWTQNGSDAGISSDTVEGSKLKKGDVWQVTVVASDGNDDSPPVSATATVANTPPQAEGAIISPTAVYDDTTVSCAGIRFVDADGDAEQYKYIWKVDGAVVSSDPELTGEFFDRGQVITCELIPTDGEGDGNRVFSAPVEVGNGVPAMDSVTIDDSAPTKNAAITFTTNGLADADGDEITLDLWWLVNGRGVSRDVELTPSHFKKGDTVQVRVTPTDGIQSGETYTSAPVTVENAPPLVQSSGFLVATAFTDSVLAPAYSVIDNDGDPVTVAFTWQVNGTTVGDTTGVLDGNDDTGNGFDRTDTVGYTLVANDGEADSEPFVSPVLTVANKAPDIPDIVFSPELVLSDEDVVCGVDGEITDADGDTFTVSATWTLDGSPYKGLTDTTDFTGDTIPFNATELTDKWGCTVTADDGTDKAVSDESVAIVRPEYIIYYAEEKGDLNNAGTTCTGEDGVTQGFYGSAYYSTPMEWKWEDVYETDPDRITVSWRQGHWGSSSSFGYYYFNGAQLAYTNLGIAKNTSCDSGRTYAVTFSGIEASGLWSSGGVNRAGIVHGCCSYFNVGVFYDEEYEYGSMRVYTDLDPEE